MTSTESNAPVPDAGSVDVEAVKRARAVAYDPFLAVNLDVNLARLAGFREISPLTYSTVEGGSFWVATGYDEVVSVLRNNNKGFVSFPNNPFGEPKTATNAVKKKLIPIDYDGPEH